MSLGAIEKLKVSPKIKSIAITEERHIAIKWSKVPLAEKYAVKRATEAGGEFEHLTWVKKCEFTDETAEENTTYWYKITAWKKLEGKKTSTKTSGVKAAVISDIKAPEKISVKSKGKKTAIELKWKNAEGTDGCIIGRRNVINLNGVCMAQHSNRFTLMVEATAEFLIPEMLVLQNLNGNQAV